MKIRAVALGVAALLAAGMACGGGEVPASSEAAEPWTRQFGPGSAQSVAVDATGDVYVAGYTVTTLGPGQPWRRDALLRKYDRVGTQLWSREFGSMAASATDEATSVAVDGEGNIYVAGITLESLRGQVSTGDKDAFLRKYDASGAELWTRQFGSPEADRALGVAVDATGNVYVAGWVFGALPGQVGAGSRDVFLRKYGTGGDEVWTRQFGSPESDSASGVAVDGEGNVYVAGWTGGVLPDQVSVGREDAFLRKYAPGGTELWSRLSESFNFVSSVVADGVGNVYVAGSTAGRKAMGDALLRKYDPTGEELWTRQFGSPMHDVGIGVAVDREGTVYVAGYTRGAMPGQTYSGMRDAFVVRLTQ